MTLEEAYHLNFLTPIPGENSNIQGWSTNISNAYPNGYYDWFYEQMTEVSEI